MGRPEPRRVAGFALLCCLALVAVACDDADSITGSGRIVTRSIPVESFSRLAVGSEFDAVVTIGDAESVTVRVDDNLVDLLDIGVSGGELHVDLQPGLSLHDVTLEAEIAASSLTAVHAEGASHVNVAGELAAEALDLAAEGASSLVASLRSDQVEVTLEGASTATLDGTATGLVVRGEGACHLDAAALQSVDLDIRLDGASSATVAVSGTLAATASGASTVDYRGSPEIVRSETSGASSINAV